VCEREKVRPLPASTERFGFKDAGFRVQALAQGESQGDSATQNQSYNLDRDFLVSPVS
jgi:hypothetical protein